MNNGAAGIGATRRKAQNCKHSICGHCGKPVSAKIGALSLSAVCSGKCQSAAGSACSCKCNGEFHQGANAKKLQRILNPELQKQATTRASRKTPTRAQKRILNFAPETIEDYLALYLLNTRVNTKSFDRFSDPNNRRANTTISLNWLSKTGGMQLDTMAQEFNNLHQFGLDEGQALEMIVEFINDNPGGVGPYIARREKEKTSWAQMEAEYYSKQQAPQIELYQAPASTPHLTPFDEGFIARRPRP